MDTQKSTLIEILIGVATGGALAILTQHFSNTREKQTAKYTAYEDFATSVNRVLRLTTRLQKLSKRLDDLKGEVMEYTKLKEAETNKEIVGAEWERLKHQTDRVEEETNELKVRSDLVVQELDRSLSRMQLSGSWRVISICQNLYYEMAKRDEKSFVKNGEQLFNIFLSEAKLELSHPYLSKISFLRNFVASRNNNRVNFRPNTSL